MPNTPKFNGQSARALRVAKNIGLREMARRIGISPGHMTGLEKGDHQPSLGIAIAIARELNVPLGAIATEAKAA